MAIDVHLNCFPSLKLKHEKSFHGGALDGAVVLASSNSEIAFLSPTLAPTVLDDPELLVGSWFDAIAHQQHGVICQLERVELPKHQWQ